MKSKYLPIREDNQPPFTCFRCGEGNAPLYCRNCAEDISKDKARLDWLQGLEPAGQNIRDTIDAAMAKQRVSSGKPNHSPTAQPGRVEK